MTLYSLPDLAKIAGVTERHARYALARDGIKPSTTVGNVGIYTPDQLPTIRKSLDADLRRKS